MTADPVNPPGVDRSFTAVRAALPAEQAAAFDVQLAEITRAEVPDLGELDRFLEGWHRTAAMIAADPEDWERVNRAAGAINAGTRPLGRTMAEVLAERGIAP